VELKGYFITTLLALTLSTSVNAQELPPDCMTNIKEVVALLKSSYQEEVDTRYQSGGNYFVTFENEETGTWSIVEVVPSGMACLRASGRGISDVLLGTPT
jgi:hypothetical protein